MDEARQAVTRLLGEAQSRPEVWDQLLPIVYGELHQIARARMAKERGHHTLQATALVHEAWLRLAKDTQLEWQNRRHFYGAAARAMQRVLVDHARAALAEKRGGGAGRVSIQLEDYGREGEPEQWLELSDCLDQLEREDPRAAEVARLRLFAGLEFQALAETLELSERTVLREWAFARARLGADLGLSGAEN